MATQEPPVLDNPNDPQQQPSGVPPLDTAIAAFVAASPALVAGAAAAASAAAIAAADKKILGAFAVFQSNRTTDMAVWLRSSLQAEFPQRTAIEIDDVVSKEIALESQFDAKQRARLERDIPKALEIADPQKRAERVEAILTREERYMQQREAAMAARAATRAENFDVKIASPRGAYWRIDPALKTHTPGCLLMAARGWWPWEVLDKIHPQLHAGCGCYLVTEREALDSGLLHPGVPLGDVADAVRTARAIVHKTGEGSLQESEFAEWWLAEGWRDPEFLAPFRLDEAAISYETETEKIRANKEKPEASKRHAFKAATWTHKNGHPRCIVCGDEERIGGICNGKPSRAEAEAWVLLRHRDDAKLGMKSGYYVDDKSEIKYALKESEREEIEALVAGFKKACDCGADNLPHEYGSACPADGPVEVRLDEAFEEIEHPRGRGGQWIKKGVRGAKRLKGLPHVEVPKSRLEFAAHRQTVSGFFSGTPGIGGSGIEAFLHGLGHSPEAIQEWSGLLHSHSAGGDAQARADAEIVRHVRARDEVGRVFLDDASAGSQLLDAWMTGGSGEEERRAEDRERWDRLAADGRDPTEWMSPLGRKGESFDSWWEREMSWRFPPRGGLYRAGDREGLVQSWTTDPEGSSPTAVTNPENRWTPNHESDWPTLRGQGYVPIGGVTKLTGSPGESEVTLFNLRAIEDSAGDVKGDTGYDAYPDVKLQETRWERRYPKGAAHGGEFAPHDALAIMRALVHKLHRQGKPEPPLQERGSRQGRYVWMRGRYVFVPRHRAFSRALDGVHFTSPEGSTNIYRNGNLVQIEGMSPPPHHHDLNPPVGADIRNIPSSPEYDPGVRADPGTAVLTPEEERVFHAVRNEQEENVAAATDHARVALSTQDPAVPPIKDGDYAWSAGEALENAGFVDDGIDSMGRSQFHHPASKARVSFTFDPKSGLVAWTHWHPTHSGWDEPHEPDNHPPRSWEEFADEVRGIAYRLASENDAEASVGEVVRDEDIGDHGGFHESTTGRIRLGRDSSDVLKMHVRVNASPDAPLQRHTVQEWNAQGVWSSYKVGAHEAIHGVNPIPNHLYSERDMKALEEALTEEIAHVEAVKLMRAHGAQEALAWLRASPQQTAALGTYWSYRRQLDKLLNLAQVAPEMREQFIRDLKFKVPARSRPERLAQRISLAQKMPIVRAREVVASSLSSGLEDESRGGFDDARSFVPVLRPDLTDMPASDGALWRGKRIAPGSRILMSVNRRVERRDSRGKLRARDVRSQVPALVTEVAPSTVPGQPFKMIVRLEDDGTMRRNVMAAQIDDVLDEAPTPFDPIDLNETMWIGGKPVSIGGTVRFKQGAGGEPGREMVVVGKGSAGNAGSPLDQPGFNDAVVFAVDPERPHLIGALPSAEHSTEVVDPGPGPMMVKPGDLIRYPVFGAGESEARVIAIHRPLAVNTESDPSAPRFWIEAKTTENSLNPGQIVALTRERMGGSIMGVQGSHDLHDFHEPQPFAIAADPGHPLGPVSDEAPAIKTVKDVPDHPWAHNPPERVPLVYVPGHNTIYVGPGGSHHVMLAEKLGLEPDPSGRATGVAAREPWYPATLITRQGIGGMPRGIHFENHDVSEVVPSGVLRAYRAAYPDAKFYDGFTEQMADKGGLSLEGTISVAEQVMERGGLDGGPFAGDEVSHPHHPDEAKRAKAHELTAWAREVSGNPDVKFQVSDWISGPDGKSGQAAYDRAMNRIVVRPGANKLTALHEVAHAMTGTHEGEAHTPEFARVLRTRVLRTLYAKHISPEAGDQFWRLVGPKVAEVEGDKPDEGDAMAADWEKMREPYRQRGIDVYRGITIKMPSRWDFIGDYSDEERFKERQAHAIKYNEALDWNRIGIHWTADKDVAERFSQPRDEIGGIYGLVIHGQVLPEDVVQPGTPEMTYYAHHAGVVGPGGMEKEVTIRPGSKVRILSGEAKLPTGERISTPNLDDPIVMVNHSSDWPPPYSGSDAERAAAQIADQLGEKGDQVATVSRVLSTADAHQWLDEGDAGYRAILYHGTSPKAAESIREMGMGFGDPALNERHGAPDRVWLASSFPVAHSYVGRHVEAGIKKPEDAVVQVAMKLKRPIVVPAGEKVNDVLASLPDKPRGTGEARDLGYDGIVRQFAPMEYDNAPTSPGYDIAMVFDLDAMRVIDPARGAVEMADPGTEDDYRGMHQAPERGESMSLDDPTNAWGDDIYGPNALRYYGSGGPSPHQDPETRRWSERMQKADLESLAAIRRVRGKPDASVTVYRAVPVFQTNAEKIDDLEAGKRHVLRTGEVPPAKWNGWGDDSNKWYEWASGEIERLRSEPEPVLPDMGQINPGDWVSLSKTYTRLHGESNLSGVDGGYDAPPRFRVISKKVRAGDVFTDGDLNEWGWAPEPVEMADPGTMPESPPVATSWHITDNPKFAFDPERHGIVNSTMGGTAKEPGIFVTQDPMFWANGHNYVRPFIAEIEHPNVGVVDGYYGGGRDQYLPASLYPQSRVKRVIPFDEYVRETYHEPGPIEEGLDKIPEEFKLPRVEGDLGQRYRVPADYRYEGPDVRDMPPDEVKAHMDRTKRYIETSERRYAMLRKFDDSGDYATDENGNPLFDEMRWDYSPTGERVRPTDEEDGMWDPGTTPSEVLKTGAPFEAVMYHGTAPKNAKAIAKHGLRFASDTDDIWLTSSRNDAAGYTGRSDASAATGGHVVRARVKLENPFVIDRTTAEAQADQGAYLGKLLKRAGLRKNETLWGDRIRRLGHDGIVYRGPFLSSAGAGVVTHVQAFGTKDFNPVEENGRLVRLVSEESDRRPGSVHVEAIEKANEPSADVVEMADPGLASQAGGLGSQTPRPSVPADPSVLGLNIDDSPGEFQRWRREVQTATGQLVRGEPIAWNDPRVPPVLYHATTNLPAVYTEGMLRAGGVGGLGGDNRDKIVSMTTKPEVAAQIAADLHLVGALGREFGDMPRQEWDDKTKTWGPDLTPWNTKVESFLHDEAARQGFEFGGEIDKARSPEQQEIDRRYKAGRLRNYDLGQWINDFFMARQSQTGMKDPLVFDGSNTARAIDPERVGVVRIPRENLNNGALLTDFDLARSYGLGEIRSYGDVPVTPRLDESSWVAESGATPFVQSPPDGEDGVGADQPSRPDPVRLLEALGIPADEQPETAARLFLLDPEERLDLVEGWLLDLGDERPLDEILGMA